MSNKEILERGQVCIDVETARELRLAKQEITRLLASDADSERWEALARARGRMLDDIETLVDAFGDSPCAKAVCAVLGRRT